MEMFQEWPSGDVTGIEGTEFTVQPEGAQKLDDPIVCVLFDLFFRVSV